MNANPDPHDPWDRRPGESPKAYAAFLKYRDMGPYKRSLRALGARESSTEVVHIALAARWSRENDWVDRAGSWDDYLAYQAQVAQVEEVHAMRRRHAALGFTLIDTVIERAKLINIEKLTVRDMLAMAQLAVQIERQARGEVTAIIETRTEEEAQGPTGADILTALRTHKELLVLAEELDRVMLEGNDQ
jgi:hypothetical protein